MGVADYGIFHFLLQLHSPLMQKNTAKPPGHTESKPKSHEGRFQKGMHLSLRAVIASPIYQVSNDYRVNFISDVKTVSESSAEEKGMWLM